MMNEPTPIPSDLLALYLAGEASDVQRRAVEDWAAALPENAAELERMRTIWDLGGNAVDIQAVDVDVAWDRLNARIAEEEGRGPAKADRRVVPIGSRVAWRKWMAAAAVIGGLVFAARWFFQPATETYLASTEAMDVVLADSSRMVLSPGSQLEGTMGKRREVRLHGQAYFEVRRDEQRPFTVDAGEVLVTVLGTAFEVAAYDTTDHVDVRVRSGRVRVEASGEQLELAAGDHVRYHKQRHFLERRPAPPAEVWGIRILQFEGAALPQVVQQLERIYKVRIALRNDRIAACRLTAEFDDETIDTILRVIAETFGLEVRRSNGEYMLDGDGC